MTKPQIWVAAFLFVFIVLFMIGRLTKDDNLNQGVPEHQPVPQSDMGAEASTPVDLISRLGCNTCHGADLTGTNMGPSLQNVSDYWNRDNLINYLRSPSAYMDSGRFKEYKKQYPNIIMPPFSQIDVKELGKIADYLLQL